MAADGVAQICQALWTLKHKWPLVALCREGAVDLVYNTDKISEERGDGDTRPTHSILFLTYHART